MKYKSVEEIFPLMKDELNRKMAKKIYYFIEENFTDIENVSLRRCISIAKKGFIKFATITPENGNSLLLHFPSEIRDNLLTQKEKFSVQYEKPKRELYINQINIPFAYIHDVNELYNLLKIAFDNPRRIRNKS
ncbi:hypothetical protein B14911_16870 [Bacillus sp. NRRL B-14911]|uniref:DUF5655 domain-containing protein n=1 Tax=Bacillus infantis NRRL B-14911 TaxID=1367477 RepID=U5L822_9BACI|nr:MULTISPECIES: hypothetical protein [Bacillus]AGX02772.1 hypothetical protein N288_04070 [Bacillus infantis NRRL B-14911]EAR67205.1 hypothetical protein B14911_16870 [Bacillus sp. NRRL B-14911]